MSFRLDHRIDLGGGDRTSTLGDGWHGDGDEDR